MVNSGLFLQDSPPVKLVNKRTILIWDIPATNGLIHIIEGPLKAPPVIVSAQLFYFFFYFKSKLSLT